MDKTLEGIVKSNVGLIWEISKKFYGIEKSDLYQAGVLGVIKAYNNYKKDGDTKFSTYAYKYIYGEMYTLANSKSIKVSKDILRLVKMIEKGKNMLAQKLMHTPSLKELALFLEIPEEKIASALMYANSVISIDNDSWPSYNEDLTIDNTITIALSVNGKLRATEEINKGLSKEELENIAKNNDNIKRHIDGKEIVKIIVIPDKMVNIVVK